MSKARKTLNVDEFLVRAGVAITNAANTPEIRAALAQYGYTAAQFQQGATLLAQAQARHAAQKQEYGEQYQATATLVAAQEQADAGYAIQRRLAALAFKKDPQRLHALGLDQPARRSFSGWLGQATIFYANVIGDAGARTALIRFNVTPEALAQGQTLVQRVVELNAAQEKEKYEAQQATQTRDAAVDELDEWLSELRTVAEIALAAHPQQLEALQFGAIP